MNVEQTLLVLLFVVASLAGVTYWNHLEFINTPIACTFQNIPGKTFTTTKGALSGPGQLILVRDDDRILMLNRAKILYCKENES